MKKTLLTTLLLLSSCAPAYAAKHPTNEDYVFRLTQKGALACISQVVEKEAGNEGYKGMELVAISILNRSGKQRVCSTVAQKGQFSSYKAASKKFGVMSPYRRAEEVVLDILVRSVHNKQNSYQGITHFHHRSVSPQWSGYKVVITYKNHTFYVKSV